MLKKTPMKKISFLLLLGTFFFASNTQGIAQNAVTQNKTTTEEDKKIKVGNYDVVYNVKGRTITNTPRVEIMSEDRGTVVVEVVVDKYGHVLQANPGATGTTTDSKYLRTKAKQCAESALFDTKPTYPIKTTGTFTITF